MASLPHKIWLQHLPTTTLHLLRLPLPYRNLSNWFHEGADGFTQKISKNDLVYEAIHCVRELYKQVKNVLSLLPFLFFSFFFSSVLLPFSQLAFLFSTLKYAKYLEGFSVDGARHVYKKACSIHLPKKPSIHLLWAAFEEHQGMHLIKKNLNNKLKCYDLTWNKTEFLKQFVRQVCWDFT